MQFMLLITNASRSKSSLPKERVENSLNAFPHRSSLRITGQPAWIQNGKTTTNKKKRMLSCHDQYGSFLSAQEIFMWLQKRRKKKNKKKSTSRPCLFRSRMLLVLHYFSRNIALGTERDGCNHLVLNLTLVSGEHVDIGWLSQKQRAS